MRSPFELFIARRYLKARRKTGFMNYITYISILGVTIGVAALIIVLSVMNGFETEVRQRIIGVDAHIRIRTFHEQVDHVVRLVEENGPVAPRALLVAPVRKLGRNDRIDIGADLRIAQHLDRVASRFQDLFKISRTHRDAFLLLVLL